MLIENASPYHPGQRAGVTPMVATDVAADTFPAETVRERRLLVRPWLAQVVALRFLLVGVPWILLRIWNGYFVAPDQDIKHYFDAAVGMFRGQIPYAGFPIEYPPGALPFFAVPYLFCKEMVSYGLAYAAQMLLVDAGILYLLARLSHCLYAAEDAKTASSGQPQQRDDLLRRYDLTVAQLSYVGLTGTLGYLIFERYDIVFGAILLAWMLATLTAKRQLWAATWLGLSIALKLVSVVLLPLYVLYHLSLLRAEAGEQTLPRAVWWRAAAVRTAQPLAVAAAVMLPFYCLAGSKFFDFLIYHRDRGLQIESTYSALLLLGHAVMHWAHAHLGMPATNLGTRFAYGATEVVGDWVPFLARASGAVLLGTALSVSWHLKDMLWAAKDAAERKHWLVRGTLGLLLVVLATNKVFSPQYLLWLTPFVGAAMFLDLRGLRPAIFALMLSHLLTSLLLFFYYINMLRFEGMGVAILLVRNALVVGACASLVGPYGPGAYALPQGLGRLLARTGAFLMAPGWGRVAVGAVAFWVVLANLSETTANDIWIQLRSGEDIFRSKVLPYTEVYSATVAGRPFIAHEWLCGVLFYVSSLLFGDAGLSILTAAVAGAIFWAMYQTFERPMRQTFWYLPLLIYLNYLVAFRLLARPHIFTILAQALLILAIERWRRTGGLRALVWLLPMQVVWINLHGAALFGPALMGMVAGYVSLAVLWPPLAMAETRVFGKKDAQQVIGMTVGLGLACLVNPYTWRIVAFSLDLMGNEYAKNRVWEWTTPFMRMNVYYYWLWIWLVAMAALWSCLLLRLRAFPVLDLAYATLATYLGVRANRFMPDFALLAFPVMARSLWALCNQGLVPAARRRFVWLELGVVSLLLCNCVVYGYAHSQREHRPLPGVGYGGDMPYNEVAVLKRLGIKGTIFNEYSDGSLIINRLWPSIRPVLDSRIDLYPLELVNDYDNAYGNPQLFADYLRRRNINIVMLYRNRANPFVIQYLERQPGWRLLLDANNRVLFVTRDSLKRAKAS